VAMLPLFRIMFGSVRHRSDMDKRAWWPYRFLYEYLELYESRFEAAVATIEIFLIAFGLWTTLKEVLASSREVGLSVITVAFESAEFLVFVLLMMTALSRLLVSVRRSTLGYSYDRALLKRGSNDEPEAFKHFLAKIEAVPIGYAPGLVPGWSGEIQYWADKIAVQTASLLSLRSWFSIDRRWQRRERDSLSEWFAEFPAALWVVPESENPLPPGDRLCSGYLSIVVPMTRHSARSIRKGQRATDLAELDLSIRERFIGNAARSDSEARGLDLLAYLHIHLPSSTAPQARDDTRLLAASIQHLAFLLQAIYGVSCDDFVVNWNFSVLCESSNSRMNAILQQLGFVRLRRDRDGSEAQRREARSYAGFTLFELKVERGYCEEPEGRNLLVMLHKMVLALTHSTARVG
jgi:hypothetical protein